MITDSNLYSMYTKSDRYFLDLVAGRVKGRKLNVWDFFASHFHTFAEIAQTIFAYDGLPYTLAKEIELRLFFLGRVGIVRDDNGELVAVDANGNGQDKYGFPTKFTFSYKNGATDKKQYSRIIGEDGVFARNTYDLFPTAIEVEQIALNLAHDDTSIMCESVNGRFMDVLVTASNADAESANKFYNDLYIGKMSHLTDKAEDIEINRATRTVSRMKDLLDAREYHLQQAYERFGIRKTIQKKERMITDEVNESNALLHFNIKDMLDQRVKMCAEIAEVFGVKSGVVCRVDIDGDGVNENEREGDEV